MKIKILMILAVFAALPVYAQYGQISQEMQQKVDDAAQSIDQALDSVLEHINQRGIVNKSDLAYIQDKLKKSKLYVLRMEPTEQAKYFVLSSWASYFSQDHQKALKESLKAFKTDPEYSDGRATLISLSLLTQNHSLLQQIKLYNLKNKESGSRGQGTLDINSDSVNFDMLGKPLPPGKFHCLNGEKLELEKEKLYVIILWKLDYRDSKPQQNSPSSLFDRDNRGQDYQNYNQSDQEEVFKQLGNLCVQSADEILVNFAAMNTDPKPDIKDIYVYLLANSGPWAQIILSDEQNSWAAYLMNLNISKPTMLMSYDNEVIYYGDVENYLPHLIVTGLTGSINEQSTPIQPEIDNSDSQETDQTEDQITVELNPLKNLDIDTGNDQKTVSQEKDQTETEQLVDDIQAQRLIERAKMDLNRKGFTTYKKGIEACREVLQKYPNSKQALEAREMLRDLPERIKKRYNVTDEELGQY